MAFVSTTYWRYTEPGPVWKLSEEERYNEKYIPSDEELEEMKNSLRTELEKLL